MEPLKFELSESTTMIKRELWNPVPSSSYADCKPHLYTYCLKAHLRVRGCCQFSLGVKKKKKKTSGGMFWEKLLCFYSGTSELKTRETEMLATTKIWASFTRLRSDFIWIRINIVFADELQAFQYTAKNSNKQVSMQALSI